MWFSIGYSDKSGTNIVDNTFIQKNETTELIVKNMKNDNIRDLLNSFCPNHLSISWAANNPFSLPKFPHRTSSNRTHHLSKKSLAFSWPAFPIKKSMKAPIPPIATMGHRKFLSVSIERLSPVHRQSFLIVAHDNRSSTIIWHHVAMLRGAASLREAEASQPRECRGPTCQTITAPPYRDGILKMSTSRDDRWWCIRHMVRVTDRCPVLTLVSECDDRKFWCGKVAMRNLRGRRGYAAAFRSA